jgi:cell division protein FtsA
MSRRGQHIVAGLDIGTTKICAIIGDVKNDGVIDILGMGTHASRGLKKGVVVNIDSTVESIRQAIEDAQRMAGLEVGSVYVGIAGGHIMGMNSTGIIAVKNQEITAREIDKVIDAAQIVAMPVDREVIHVLPQEFIVDEHRGILDPTGMSGVRLEARVHIVSAAVASAHNIVKCVNKADLEVEDIVLEQLASSQMLLSPEERELGAVLIDIGGGSTNVALISGHGVKHTAVLGVGGNHITNDLAFGLNTTLPEAERLKKAYGCTHSSVGGMHDAVEVRSLGERELQRHTRMDLCNIIAPRVEEILQMVLQEVRQSGYADSATSGVVLTGGTALLPGLAEVAEDIFRLPARCGAPTGISGLVDMVNSPMYATGVGLLHFAIKGHHYGRFQKFSDDHLFGRIYHRMRDWFGEFLA